MIQISGVRVKAEECGSQRASKRLDWIISERGDVPVISDVRARVETWYVLTSPRESNIPWMEVLAVL